MLITSPHNPRVSKLQDLYTTRGRKKSGLFLMEGPHLLEAVLHAGIVPQEVYYQPELLQRAMKGKGLLEQLVRATGLPDNQLIEVSERVMDALSDAQAPQGVVSVLPLAAFESSQIQAKRSPAARPVLLVLDDLADPGNLGTMLRTALAADVHEVLLTANCVDCFNPKVLRSAAGAHVALPIETNLSWEIITERVARHCAGSPRVLLAEAGSSHSYYEQDLAAPFALIIGNEAQGPSPDARALATLTISIPLANGVESLNAAMAAGILLYESVRQRR